MGKNKFKSPFIKKIYDYEKTAKKSGIDNKKILEALDGSYIGLIYFVNGGTQFIKLENGMIGNCGRGLQIKIPPIEILKDPLKLKQYLMKNSDINPIKRIDMR